MTGDDFITRLQLQLREAAEREERRGFLARARATLRARRLLTPLVAGVAVACALIAAVLFVAARPAGDQDAARPVPSGEGLSIVFETQIANRGGATVYGFGSVWVRDPGTDELLRIDPRTRKVIARIPVPGAAGVVDAAGSVWAAVDGAVLRVDPATNTVSDRVRLDVPPRSFPLLLAGDGVVWAVTPFEMWRINPRTNAVDRTVPLANGSYQVRGFTRAGDTIYVLRGDGSLRAFDARTGARVRGPWPRLEGQIAGVAGGVAVTGYRSVVTATDLRTGEVRWRTDVGASAGNDGFLAGGSLWLHMTDSDTNRDRLLRIDVGDGKVVGAITLPEFGFGGSDIVGRDYWLLSPSGKLMVIR